MPDKKDFGYAFPCDGPGRGGTCDISAWDAFYLAAFWMLNTVSWIVFYIHWAAFSAPTFTTNKYIINLDKKSKQLPVSVFSPEII